ncbi:MAG: DUF308 domain-containing protein [Bacteroidales bacterium]|nr:DUF308 domain-containing protein [Bacteroidales bacterium]
METQRFKNWWFLAVNGFIFALFGFLILWFSEDSIKTILRYFGFVMLAGGAIMLVAGINNIRRDKSGAMILVESIMAIAIGIALLLFPQASVELFLIMIGIWAIIIGIVQLVIIVNIKGAIASKNLHLVNGLLIIALGVVLLFNPFQWALFLIKMIGAFAALFGILLIYFAFVIRIVKQVDEQH